MEITYEHTLSQRVAYTRINNLLDRLQEEYGAQISDPHREWNSRHTQMDFSVQILGAQTQGQVYLEPGHVRIEGTVPGIAKLFSRRIEKMIRKQLEDLLA